MQKDETNMKDRNHSQMVKKPMDKGKKTVISRPDPIPYLLKA